MPHQRRQVTAARRIPAPAETIFRLLADPRSHREIDGSGMLLGPRGSTLISSVGDMFVMGMRSEKLGEYEMNNFVTTYRPHTHIAWRPEPGRGHPREERWWGQQWSFRLDPDGPAATFVVETYDCSAADPTNQAAVRDGEVWTDAMNVTLELLAIRCT